MNDPRYPIGKFEAPNEYSADSIAFMISELEILPQLLNKTVEGLSDADLEKTYREGGWTVRQIVHHLADSHVNMYLRLKVTLTEDTPTIKPYDENLWAAMKDAKHAEIALSLPIITAIHQRIVEVLRNMQIEEFDRTYYHPQYDKTLDLKFMLALYSWHGKHHVGQIKNALGVSQA
jgi:uncharacterized damage-inducible protein DinB